MHTLHKISVPVIAVTLAFTLASCTGAPAEEKSASGSSSSAELKLETSEEIQTKLSLIEVLLKSQEEAAAKGFTDDQGVVFFAYDPETKREVYLEDFTGYDGQPMPPRWSESTGQIPTFYNLIDTVGSGAISDYSYSADNNEIKFDVSGEDPMTGSDAKQTIRFYIDDKGVIQKIEQNGYTQELVYSVTDQAKEYFATAISQEEYSQKEQEYYESQDPGMMFPE